MNSVKAFHIYCQFLDHENDNPKIIFSSTRSKAFWTIIRSYCDVYNDSITSAFKKFKILRCPKYDSIAYKYKTEFVYDCEFLDLR